MCIFIIEYLISMIVFQLLKIKAIGIISALIVYTFLSDYSKCLVQGILQTALISVIVYYSSGYIQTNKLSIEMCLGIGIAFAFFVAIIKFVFKSKRGNQEHFYPRAIGTSGTTNVSKRLCPDVDSIIRDTECVPNPNDVPEDEEIRRTNRFLRATRQIIAETEEYLNVSRPDERWTNLKEMEEHDKKAV